MLTFLFILSFLMVFLTGYLIASLLDKDKSIKGLIYVFISAFAQIIFIAEILSMFKPMFKPYPFLTCNVVILFLALIAWLIAGKPLWSVDCRPTFRKVKTCFNLDKSFYILLAGWLFLVGISLFICFFDSGASGDGKIYHILRAVHYAINNSINHFPTSEFRNNVFPFNSEIMYSWIYMFLHRTAFLGFFSFTGYIFSMIGVYKLMEHFKICVRRRLWTLFILSSFACVLLQMCDTETDIIIAALVTNTMFLFLDALKNKNKITLFMSALCYAIAIGTKSTGGLTVPAMTFFVLLFIFKYKNFKYLLYYILFGAINFALFGAYNYIMNYYAYGNFIANAGAVAIQTNVYGLKGTLANFIRHCYTFVDFTGFNITEEFKSYLDYGRDLILTSAQVSTIPERISSRPELFANNLVLTPFCGCGVLGILILIPCWFLSFLQPIKYRKHFARVMLLFGVLLFINLMSLSATIAFMQANIRFITTFIIISSPILCMSYFRSRWSPIKMVFIIIAVYAFIFSSTHNIIKTPSVAIPQIIKHPTKLREIREEWYCYGLRLDKLGRPRKYPDAMCDLYKDIKEYGYSPKNKILILGSAGETLIKPLLLNYSGWNIDTNVLYPHYDRINFEDYNLIVYPTFGQVTDEYNDNNDPKLQKDIAKKLLKSNEYACFYEGKNKLNNPLQIKCQLSDIFLKNRHFKPILRNRQFIIMENKNKPAIKR